jgi:hypothetical protein
MAKPFVNTVSELSAAEEGSATGFFASFGFRKGVSALGHLGGIWLGVSTAALAIISQWDHHVEKKRIAGEYDQEIAVGLGKRASDVKIDDMEKAAKGNPAIKEALRRSTTKRNLSVAVTLVAAVAAIAFIAPVALSIVPALAGHAIIHALLVGGLTALGFMGVEAGLEKIGEKIFRTEEPSLKGIMRHPGRQSELSVPGQITYLAHQQAKGKRVTQEQVMTVFTSASPGLDAQIQARYGKPFAKLGENSKHQALSQFGAQYNVAELTAGINDKNIRPQELAFAAYGQESGVVPAGPPHIGALGREVAALDARIAVEAPATNQDVERQKLAFANSRISGTALGAQQAPEETAWRRRIDAQRRQQAAMGVA